MDAQDRRMQAWRAVHTAQSVLQGVCSKACAPQRARRVVHSATQRVQPAVLSRRCKNRCAVRHEWCSISGATPSATCAVWCGMHGVACTVRHAWCSMRGAACAVWHARCGMRIDGCAAHLCPPRPSACAALRCVCCTTQLKFLLHLHSTALGSFKCSVWMCGARRASETCAARHAQRGVRSEAYVSSERVRQGLCR